MKSLDGAENVGSGEIKCELLSLTTGLQRTKTLLDARDVLKQFCTEKRLCNAMNFEITAQKFSLKFCL